MHHVGAVDADGGVVLGYLLGPVVAAALHHLFGDHILVPVIKIREPGVDRPPSLQETGREAIPMIARDDPGHPVCREDALLAGGIVGQGEGGPKLAQRVVGPRQPPREILRLHILEDLQHGSILLASRASRLIDLVEA